MEEAHIYIKDQTINEVNFDVKFESKITSPTKEEMMLLVDDNPESRLSNLVVVEVFKLEIWDWLFAIWDWLLAICVVCPVTNVRKSLNEAISVSKVVILTACCLINKSCLSNNPEKSVVNTSNSLLADVP